MDPESSPLETETIPMNWYVRSGTSESHRSVTFDELKTIIWGGSPVRFSHCLFTESIDFRSLPFMQAQIFEDCIFREHFDATDARFDKSLTLVRCTFQKSLTLQYAKIKGALILRGSIIHWPEGSTSYPSNVDSEPFQPPPRFRSALWEGIQIEGSLEADRLKVYGSLDLGHAEILGAMNLRGAQIGLGKYGGRMYLRQARVDGDVEMEPAVEVNPESEQSQKTKIYGSLSIGASELRGRLNIRGIWIKGCLHAITVHIKGRVLAGSWEHPTFKGSTIVTSWVGTHNSSATSSIHFQDATIEEAVWLHGIRTCGSVEFDNARIGSSLELSLWASRKLGGTQCRRSRIGANSAGESLVIKNARISANVVLDGAELEGRIAGQNSQIGGAFLCRPRIGWISPRECKEFRPSIGANADGKSLSLYGAKIVSTIDLSGAKLDGAVRLRAAKVGAVMAKLWRGEDERDEGHSLRTEIGKSKQNGEENCAESFYLYGVEVDGNVCAQDVRMSGGLSLELAKIHGSLLLDRSHVNLLTESSLVDKGQTVGFNMEKARIDNDVTMLGTQVRGDFAGRGCHVLGSFRATVDNRGENPAIYGRLDLSESEVIGDIDLKHLIVKSDCRSEESKAEGGARSGQEDVRIDSDEWKVDISLSGAKFGSLTAELRATKKCPTFDLRGLKFDSLNINLESDSHIGVPFQRDLRELATGSLIAGLFVMGFALWFFEIFPDKLSVEGWIASVAAALAAVIAYAMRYSLRKKVPRNNPYAFLLGATKFDIPSYLCIEYWLANTGRPKEADEVHYSMRKRELRDLVHGNPLAPRKRFIERIIKSIRGTEDSLSGFTNHGLPWHEHIWKWLYLFVAGSGTRVMWLIQLHALVFVFSWLFVFSNPASVERPSTYIVEGAPVSGARSVSEGSYEWMEHNGTPKGIPWTHEERIDLGDLLEARQWSSAGAWNQADAFWVALNIQVPILHIWARDEWEPASRRGFFGCRYAARPLFGMQYETFAGFIQLFSYLTIPMIIACASRSVKRREPA